MPRGFIMIQGTRFRVSDIVRYDSMNLVTSDGRVHRLYNIEAVDIDRMIEEAAKNGDH